MPRESELRFNWIEAQTSRLEVDRMAELVLDAWRMVVPKKVWSAWQQQAEGTAASEGRWAGEGR